LKAIDDYAYLIQQSKQFEFQVILRILDTFAFMSGSFSVKLSLIRILNSKELVILLSIDQESDQFKSQVVLRLLEVPTFNANGNFSQNS
jgi:hypothetical protein